MKTFVCELCGGTQFAKSNGAFVCQGCGTQFSAEDMRGMMMEVPDSAPTSPVRAPRPAPKPAPVAEEPEEEYYEEEVAPRRPVAPRSPAPKPVAEEPEEEYYEEEVAPRRSVAPRKPAPRGNGTAPRGNGTAPRGNGTAPRGKGKEEEKKKKIGVGMIISIAATVILFAFFVVGIVMALDKESTGGNVLLLVGGIFDLIIAFILYKIMIHIERYNCPKCGAKRVHHREYKRTTKKEKEYKDSSITTYTHHYHDTYECPECGETRHEQVTGSGGSYYEYDNGNDRDETRPPKEF